MILVVATFLFCQLDLVTACDLTYYQGREFTGPNIARVHRGFLSSIKNINSYAKQCNVKVFITGSYRSTTLSSESSRSNHLIGHAIDMNLVDTATKRFCNSKCLPSSDRPPGATCFINKIRTDNVLRWGGDFSTPSPVHIDDNTGNNNPSLWDDIHQSIQNDCINSACDLTKYLSSEFTGPNSARVHKGFLAEMKDIHRYAVECNVKVYVTSSYRSTTQVSGAIVTPAVISNHMIGHAIDMNLVDTATGKFCNSKCLPLASRPAGVTCFINKISSDNSVLRWGGDFNKPDPVHIDDATNINNRALWDQLYQSFQKNC